MHSVLSEIYSDELTHSETRYKLQILWKLRKRYAPAGRLYSTFWPNLSKNFIFGVLYPYHWTDGGEIWHEGGKSPSPPLCQISPHRCNVSPLWGKKPQSRPL